MLLGEEGPPPPYLWLGNWMQLLGLLGYRAEAVRLMLSRACRSAVFIRVREGRNAYYRPTNDSVHLMYQSGYKVYVKEEEPWDDHWLLLTYQIDDDRRELRERLKWRLCTMGFGRLAHSLWLSPYDLRAQLAMVVDELNLAGQVIFFRAEAPNQVPAELAAQAWHLPKMADHYRVLIGELERILHELPPIPTGEQAFAAIVEAEVRYCMVAGIDPHLPSALLPPDWPGQEARAALHRLGERGNRIAWDFFHRVAVTCPEGGGTSG